jgi:CRISPR-associated endonuclease/helicase Cas3
VTKFKIKKIKIPALPLSKCIGKTYDHRTKIGMTVQEHCRIVGHVSKVFITILNPYIKSTLLLINIFIFCALHDIGKISPGFIIKIYKSLLKNNPKLAQELYKVCPELFNMPEESFEDNHAVISEASFQDEFQNLAPAKLIKIQASGEGSHHGRRNQTPYGASTPRYGGEEWEKVRRNLINILIKEFGKPKFKPLTQEQSEIITGYLSLCDWIGSDEKFFPAVGKIKDIKKKALESIHLLGWKKSIIKKGLSFKKIFGFSPNKVQENFILRAKKPGVYILESSPATGKTEAALFVAYKLLCEGNHSGIFFALPTRITSNRMFSRIEKFIINSYQKSMAPKLIHGMSFITDLEHVSGGEELSPGGDWFRENRKAMLLPFGVGTVDQLLLCVLKSKFNFVRTFGLAGKIIILDEVHCYDTYTSKLLDLLIEKLKKIGCTVIILSATLTKQRKKELLDSKNLKNTDKYPLITIKNSKGVRAYECGTLIPKKYKIKKITTNYKKFFEEVKKRALIGQQVMWVCNTVDRSVAVYKTLKNDPDLSHIPIGVMHSRFPQISKNSIEETWSKRLGKNGNRETGSILVGTQVLEQSIDFDSDFTITDLAPADLLLQRMGRVWRHSSFSLRQRHCNSAEIWISSPDLKKIKSPKELKEAIGIDCKIYSPFILWRSYQIFKNINQLTMPNDICPIVEKTYQDFNKSDPEWLKELWDDSQKLKDNLKEMAISSTGSHVEFFDDNSEDIFPIDVSEEENDIVRTRKISVPSVTFLLLAKPFKDEGNLIKLTFLDGTEIDIIKGKKSLLVIKKIGEWLVKVPLTKSLQDIQSPEWLQKISFGFPIPTIIYSDDNSIHQQNGSPTGFFYEPDCGVYRPKELNV